MPVQFEHLSPIGSPGHLCFHLGGNHVATLADLPAATECAIDGYESENGVTAAGHGGIVDRQLLLLCGQDDRVIVLPLSVADDARDPRSVPRS